MVNEDLNISLDMATRGAVAAYTLEVLLEILREKALFTDSDIEVVKKVGMQRFFDTGKAADVCEDLQEDLLPHSAVPEIVQLDIPGPSKPF
jgi:hypothetical protein